MGIAGFVLGICSLAANALGNLDLWGYGETVFNKSSLLRILAGAFGVAGIILSAAGMIHAAAAGLFFLFAGLLLGIAGTVIAFVLIVSRLIFLHSV
jgi:hypothetical protein